VSLRSLARAWNAFLFAPQKPTPVALFRILYGLLIILDLILLRPDWLTWFGPRGMISQGVMHQMEPGARINLFSLIPQTDFWVNAYFWFFLAAAALLTIGFATRASSIAVFLCLTSLHQRNLYIIHSGDALLRVIGFFLMFAPAGAAFSADRLIRIWKGREGVEIEPRSPWAQRMIQFEVALLYLVTFWMKSQGPSWADGTALYYVYHLDQFRRFPLPSWIQAPLMVKLATWTTLAIEFSLGVMVWFKELRYPVLVLGACLHLSLEYSMNIPLFQWVMLSSYLTFIEPEDLDRVWRTIRDRVARRLPAPVTVIYDGNAREAARTANVLRAIDILEKLRLVDMRAPGANAGIPMKLAKGRVLVSTPIGPRAGFAGLSYLARVIPLLWPLALPAVLALSSKQDLRTMPTAK